MRLLLIEDDARIAEPVSGALREAGYAVTWRSDGPSGLEEALAEQYPVIILDVMLPGMDGFEVASQLRQADVASPIVFLTARDALPDRVLGLDLGGDAYLTKPFELPELLATLRAIVRRGETSKRARLEFAGHGMLDTRTRQVWWDGLEVKLTAREYGLLESLALTPGRWFSREELLERVWGPDFPGEARVVDVFISYLRRKLGPEAIQSQRGRGYCLEAA